MHSVEEERKWRKEREDQERKSKSRSWSESTGKSSAGVDAEEKEGVMAIVSCGRPSKLRSRAGGSTTQRPLGPSQGRLGKAWIFMGEAQEYQPHR